MIARCLVAALCALALLLLRSTTASAEPSSLEQAYQREFAFLEAEKHTLEKRIAELKAEQQAKVAAARAEIEALQGRVTSLSLEADRKQEALLSTERQADVASEGSDVVETLLSQIDATLEKGNRKLPKLPDNPSYEDRLAQLEAGFSAALPLLDRAGQVRRERGAYFAGDGQRIEGEVLHVGSIASYGLDPRAPGALAPAGAGRLQVWPEPAGVATAQALAQGGSPETLSTFLYESLEERVDKKADKSVREIIDSGGVIGWVIVAGGVLAMLMALLRALLLAANASGTTRVMQRIAPLVERRQIEAALAVARQTRGSLGRVLTTTLQNVGRPRQELEDSIDEAVLHEQPALDRFGNAVFVIAAVAPLLGLLGTVTGMIATFDIITEFGTGNPKLLSNGISIALVTTELGLIVAIPALLLGNFLNGWGERIKDDLDRAALRVTNLAHGAHFVERPRAGSLSEAVGDLDAEALAT